MIQRIQSIFLFLTAVAGGLMFAVPIASIETNAPESALFKDRVYELQDNPILMVMFGLVGLLALVSIFQFKNRSRQLTLNRILIILNLLGVALALFLFMQDSPNIPTDNISEGFGIFLPVLGFIFVFLANRFIKKDDNLVKSMDRLR